MPTILIVDDSAVDRALAESSLLPIDDLHLAFVETGREALQMIATADLDLVITDLIMPEVDGLQVVRFVRDKYKHIPVILMTSASSESNAVEALKAGAASFVPKTLLAERLLETTQKVLDLLSGAFAFNDVFGCLGAAELEFQLENDMRVIPSLIDFIQKTLVCREGIDVTESIRMSLALEEGILNALLHGNLEMPQETPGLQATADALRQRAQQHPYSQRKIHVRLRFSTQRLEFVVADEGPGFNHRVAAAESPPPGDRLARRGLMLMRAFMDEVIYNDQGNELRLIKRF